MRARVRWQPRSGVELRGFGNLSDTLAEIQMWVTWAAIMWSPERMLNSRFVAFMVPNGTSVCMLSGQVKIRRISDSLLACIPYVRLNIRLIGDAMHAARRIHTAKDVCRYSAFGINGAEEC